MINEAQIITGSSFLLCIGPKIFYLVPGKKKKKGQGTLMSLMCYLLWNYLEKEASERLSDVPLTIHVVSCRCSAFIPCTSLLSHMTRLCYSSFILNCKATQRVKAHRGQKDLFPKRNNVSCNILGHPLQTYDQVAEVC